MSSSDESDSAMDCTPPNLKEKAKLAMFLPDHAMDNLDDSENNAKISDSAYSNSCSNSQSRRSHSSKSTHSGSHSSGSSGYGGKPSAFNNNDGQPAEKRSKDKDGKKKKQSLSDKTTEVINEVEETPPEQTPVIEAAVEKLDDNVKPTSSPPTPGQQQEKGSENMDITTPERSSNKDEVGSSNTPLNSSTNYMNCKVTPAPIEADGFSCVISMHDGVVMYTTSSLTATLGFPKDMWIGRSFIDFVHPRDRNTFASHITSGLAVPKNVNGTQEPAPSTLNSVCTMVCRIRRYRGLSSGFGVKERAVTFMPFLLKLSFKNICEEEGKAIYLVIQASPFFSAFKTPNEVVVNPVPFVIRHAANGSLEYIDPESVPYLGYLPQDLAEKDVLALYHHEDLPYLRQVYEAIVKEGGVPRSKPYRMMAQNGDYLKVETEWSSFINPWSRKLEFVIGKHQIIEGPTNPDVFQAPENDKCQKISEEDKNKAQGLRNSIIRIINEVLTKPAEVAKQQMTKRCQDLASFMESLMEDQPKTEDELRLEIHDPDNSYYERDSVMLGGISPHHDDNDSKSSTATPLSYTQLNYNETLQRYFKSHQPYSYEDYNTATGENILGLFSKNPSRGKCLSPVVLTSGDSGEMSSSESGATVGGPAPIGDYLPPRLTESLLNKHNEKMEKELVKMHRETRSSKGEREKVVIETRQKKKEHLARCNAAFQPTSAGNSQLVRKSHGIKRASKQQETEGAAHKHHCSTPRQSRRRQSTSAAPVQPTSTVTTTAGNPWPGGAVNGMNTFILGVGIPQQMSIMSPMTMPGMFPLYYAPVPTSRPTTDVDMNNSGPSSSTAPFQPPLQCMMYGQAMYGSPIMYSPINPQMAYSLPHNLLTQTVQNNPMNHPLGLARSNFEEACKQSLLKTKSYGSGLWKAKRLKTQAASNNEQNCTDSNSSSSNTLNRSTGAVPSSMPSRDGKKGSEEIVDRTDGESSYSSFYSSFFKTESGSAEESGDAKRNAYKDRKAMGTTNNYYEPPLVKKIARRKTDPPWMEQVCVTSELVYKYQILTKSMDEVLKADKIKMNNLEQPSLVNEQLEQLYLDLQLEGVAARLTLEEGITSSSSSGEETTTITSKCRRKREYSKLVMIYEEDAPLPPSPEEPERPSEPSTSTDV